MRATISTAILALASSVFAQTPGFDVISKPTKGEVVPAGSKYLIDWEPSTNWTGTVTIDLLGGPDQAGLQNLSVIAKGVDSTAGQYSWAVDKTIGELNTYGLRITLDSDPTVFQYSFPFAIKANSSSSSSSTTSPSSTSGSGSSTTETTVTTPTITSAPSGGNLSTTGTPSQTLVTTTTTGTSKTSPTSSTVPTNPGAIIRSSSLALLAGLALAFFTL